MSAYELPAPVREALADFPAGRDALAAGARAEPLAGGLTNRTWRVRAPGADWVVRTGTGRDATLAIDRRAELVALDAAGAAGLAPPVVHAVASRGLCVLAYRPGHSWTRGEARSIEGVRRLGARVRDLHRLAVPPHLPVLHASAAIAHLLAAARPGDVPVARATLAARAHAALEDYAPAPAAFCHHDLHHLNVIDDGTLTFVDWEYAAAGDPWLDLAAWASYHDLDAAARAALVDAYAGPVDDAGATTRLDRAVRVFECLEALWYDAAGAWARIDPEHRDALVARLHGEPA